MAGEMTADEAIAGGGVQLTGDRELLEYALYNLLTNAVKYSPADTEIHVYSELRGGELRLAVQDQGIGMDAKEIKRIFQKFYRVGNEDTRTAQGTGLGLYLCRKITQDHKMHLQVSDNQPKGTIFTVRFNLIQI